MVSYLENTSLYLQTLTHNNPGVLQIFATTSQSDGHLPISSSWFMNLNINNISYSIDPVWWVWVYLPRLSANWRELLYTIGQSEPPVTLEIICVQSQHLGDNCLGNPPSREPTSILFSQNLANMGLHRIVFTFQQWLMVAVLCCTAVLSYCSHCCSAGQIWDGFSTWPRSECSQAQVSQPVFVNLFPSQIQSLTWVNDYKNRPNVHLTNQSKTWPFPKWPADFPLLYYRFYSGSCATSYVGSTRPSNMRIWTE